MNIYQKTLELLDNAGWGQGDDYNPYTGTYCVMGALTKVQYNWTFPWVFVRGRWVFVRGRRRLAWAVTKKEWGKFGFGNDLLNLLGLVVAPGFIVACYNDRRFSVNYTIVQQLLQEASNSYERLWHIRALRAFQRQVARERDREDSVHRLPDVGLPVHSGVSLPSHRGGSPHLGSHRSRNDYRAGAGHAGRTSERAHLVR